MIPSRPCSRRLSGPLCRLVAAIRQLGTSGPSPRRRRRPGVELLEGRTLLTTILVDTFDDVTDPSDGRISLREALVQAVGTPAEDDTIILPAGDYVLTDGQVAIHDPTGRLTLRSEGGTAVIDAAHQSRVFQVSSDSHVEFQGLMITGGVTADNGGGIINFGELTVTSSTLSGNLAGIGGVRISNGGTLRLDSSTLGGNAAAGHGGAIINFGDGDGGEFHAERQPCGDRGRRHARTGVRCCWTRARWAAMRRPGTAGRSSTSARRRRRW